MKKIEVEYKEYKQAVIDILNLNLPQLKSKYAENIYYIYSFIHDASLGYSSENYIYLKRAANETNYSIDLITNKAGQLISELSHSDQKDYYSILEVQQNSTTNEIRDNWLRLVKENHPDVKGEKGAEVTKELNEAYNILSNKDTRFEYDSSFYKYLPLKIKKTGFSLFENRKFLLVCSIIIVFLLGSFVSGFFEKPMNKKASRKGDILNQPINERLNTYAEVNSEELEEKYIEEVESIYSKFNGYTVYDASLTNDNKDKGKSSENNEFEDSNNIPLTNKIRNGSMSIFSNDQGLVLSPENLEISDDNTDKLNKNVASAAKTVEKRMIDNSENNNVLESNKSGEIKADTQEDSLSDDFAKIDKNKINRPSDSSLYFFVSDFVSAYRARDFNKLSSLFSTSATENGKKVEEFMPLYKKNFSKNEIVRYDVKINKKKITSNTGKIDGDFIVIYKKINGKDLKSREGNIIWNLEWIGNEWKIMELNYNFEKKNKKI